MQSLVQGVVPLAEREPHQMVPCLGVLAVGIAEGRQRDRGHSGAVR